LDKHHPGKHAWTLALLVAGLLVHGVYLSGAFTSMYHGVEAGVAALIAHEVAQALGIAEGTSKGVVRGRDGVIAPADVIAAMLAARVAAP
jgi:hypothetical protein